MSREVSEVELLEGNIGTETGHLGVILEPGSGDMGHVRVWIQADELRGAPHLTATVEARDLVELVQWVLVALEGRSELSDLRHAVDQARSDAASAWKRVETERKEPADDRRVQRRGAHRQAGRHGEGPGAVMGLKDTPTCPACGHEESDAWEIDFGPGLEGNTHVWCEACDAEYACERSVTVYYRCRALSKSEVQ